MCRRLLLFATLLISIASPVGAKTTLDIEIGWGNTIRLGRWTPIVVTLADPDGPDAIVEVMSSHDRLYGVVIRQYVGTLAATSKQFQLLAPIESYSPYFSDPAWIVVRNAKTGKILAKTDPEDSNRVWTRPQLDSVEAGFHMVGVSGQTTKLGDLKSITGAQLSVDYLAPSLLPITPNGYDMLDVLVLNAPDLNELASEQQQAIVDWVKAGGNLVLWPGETAPPDTGPLIDLLPCSIGKLGTAEIPEQTLSQVTLAKRFGRLNARALAPAHGGEAVQLFGDDSIFGYQRRAGLGRVFCSPVNLADFHFADQKQLWALWTRILEPMITLPSDALTAQARYQNRYEGAVDDFTKQRVADVLGTVPGAGRFGFSYVAVVLIGMMVVVGPVDWFVLRLLKRQAWTWVTTSGWIALITLGAIYVGHIVKSGELHHRTFSLIDQADGATVGRQDFVGIYSPRTAAYNLAVQPGGWWEPFAPGMGEQYGYVDNERANQVEFHQTYRDNLPAEMQINVWSLRFLEGQTIEPGPALLDASFKLEQSPGGKMIASGKVTNRTTHTFRGLRLVTATGEVQFHPDGASDADIIVNPGASVEISGLIVPQATTDERPQNYYSYAGDSTKRADPNELWAAAKALGGDRLDRINRLLRSRTYGCLLTGVEKPAPPATLDAGPANEQHWQIIRALVPLEQ